MIECRLAPAIVLIVFFLLSGCAPKPGETGGANAEGEPTSESTDSARFTDVAESAGLSYQWKIAGERPLNVLQTIGNGCAFLDYDSDGNLDILLVGPNPALYKGDGQGHFTDTTKESGLDSLKGQFLGCAVGDYDNDGFPDVYLTAYRGGALLHNEGRLTEDGRRTTDQKEVGSRQSAVGSYAQGPGPNAQRSESVSRHPSSVSRRFRDVTGEAGIGPQPWGTAASFADVDGDGRLDLFVGNYVKFGPNTEPRLCEYSGHMSACGPRFYQPERAVLY